MAPRLPPPIDPFLERQMQQQLAPLAEVPPPEREQREKGFVLFHAMPGSLVSAVIHLLLFLLLSLYVARDPDRGAKLVSLSVVDSEDDGRAEEFEELIVDMPPVVASEALEAAPDQAFWDDVLLAAPEIAHPEVVVPALETATLQPDVESLPSASRPGKDPGFTVGGDARGGLALRGERRQQALTQGATVESENAVQLALQWLVRHQRDDGSWCFNQQLGDHDCAGCRCSVPGPYVDALHGATGMVLLALLGAGHTQLQGEYREEVSAGLRYLIQQQASDGSLMDPSGNMYSHGLATLALCEALAMTRDQYQQPVTAMPRWGEPAAAANDSDGAGAERRGRPADGYLLDFAFDATVPVTLPALTRAAQEAITFIERAQHPAGGGWRYRPRQPGDTSVVGWQLMALKSAYLAGLEVDPKVAAKAVRFLDFVSEDRVGSCYGYTYGNKRPYLEKNAPITATTPIGLLCRMYTGWERRRPGLSHGVERLNFWARPGKGLYYYYYATQVMHHYGGPPWEKWNGFMRDYLVHTQSHEGSELGSWSLDGHHDEAGRLYCTALAAMTLEVYYRYSPIYGNATISAKGKVRLDE